MEDRVNRWWYGTMFAFFSSASASIVASMVNPVSVFFTVHCTVAPA
jgi:hypothetical protein